MALFAKHYSELSEGPQIWIEHNISYLGLAAAAVLLLVSHINGSYLLARNAPSLHGKARDGMNLADDKEVERP